MSKNGLKRPGAVPRQPLPVEDGAANATEIAWITTIKLYDTLDSPSPPCEHFSLTQNVFVIHTLSAALQFYQKGLGSGGWKDSK